MRRKGFFTIDAVVGIIVATIVFGLILFGALRVENLVKARRLAEANSLLGTYLAKVTKICLTNPNYSDTTTETLGNDEFTVTAECTQINSSLIEAKVEVEGEGIKVEGISYASK